jgi:phage gpG-like protein
VSTRVKVNFVGGSMVVSEGVGEDSIAVMQRYIADVGKRARDLTPVFNQWVPVLFQQEEEIFDAEGIPAWPALSPAYADWKSRHFGDLPILERSGRLKESLTQNTSDTIMRVGPRSMSFGTRVPYSAYLQEGSFKGSMGPRPHLYMVEDNFEEMSVMALDYIAQGGGTRRFGTGAILRSIQ